MKKEFEGQYLHEQRSYLLAFEDQVEQAILAKLECDPLADSAVVAVKIKYMIPVVDMLENIYHYGVIKPSQNQITEDGITQRVYTELTITW